MIRISEAIESIVDSHRALRFGFYHGLLNLTKVARYLKPSIEARTKKDVTDAAVLMNLSRLQKKLARAPQSQSRARRDQLVLDQVNIQSGLCAATVAKSSTSHRELNRVFNSVHAKSGFLTITEGLREVTVIVEAANLRLLTSALTSPPRILHEDLASVSVTFDQRYLKVKGILFQLLEEIALQDINVIEIASTATEFSIFLREDDVQLAFDAIYNRFSRRRARA
jgi:aspartokinase